MRLCRELDGEIVSADSVQLYRGLDLGSNKPDADALKAIPHHLIDVGMGNDPWSAGRWLHAAEEAIDDITSRGKAPIVVGGTMMYLRWLVRGAPDAPAASAAAVEKAEELLFDCRATDNWSGAVAILAQKNSERAATIEFNNWYRLSRALEIEIQREGFDSREQSVTNYDTRCFFLAPHDRISLFRKIDSRCEDMLERGLVTEVAHLFVDGQLPPNSSAAKAIGYRQTLDFLQDQATALFQDHIESIDLQHFEEPYLDFLRKFATATRNYAAAQIKWYRRDPDFAVIDTNSFDLCAQQVSTAFSQSRHEYENWLHSPSQQQAKLNLIANNKVMRTYASHPPRISINDLQKKKQLHAAKLAIQKVHTFLHSNLCLSSDDDLTDSFLSSSKLASFRLRALKQREAAEHDSSGGDHPAVESSTSSVGS
eukprot:CAMPEP_0197309114 /NCGR_PEP_ID=MMETSP0891-20130614/7676_1 /TAXON_ID=44058 ORGANISM="Aureoumbra lagunensis, Strain CCMP1510" /NCGR_SAMPLE_ID=MMETSP0891 /ASSEMBLY_ACC=CAM_ASM_000534 /LENGTH=424 /DNA_ID=CAMNT_0042794001 /DNA_START=225 /DNA_END=1499 /DNA_ORIENTATION=+